MRLRDAGLGLEGVGNLCLWSLADSEPSTGILF